MQIFLRIEYLILFTSPSGIFFGLGTLDTLLCVHLPYCDLNDLFLAFTGNLV
jgi:hypothetical protein